MFSNVQGNIEINFVIEVKSKQITKMEKLPSDSRSSLWVIVKCAQVYPVSKRIVHFPSPLTFTDFLHLCHMAI